MMDEIMENNPMVLHSDINKIHTTELGFQRIRKNLAERAESLKEDSALIDFFKKLISSSDCKITRKGKNWYCQKDGIVLTVNGFNYCVITAKNKA